MVHRIATDLSKVHRVDPVRKVAMVLQVHKETTALKVAMILKVLKEDMALRVHMVVTVLKVVTALRADQVHKVAMAAWARVIPEAATSETAVTAMVQVPVTWVVMAAKADTITAMKCVAVIQDQEGIPVHLPAAVHQVDRQKAAAIPNAAWLQNLLQVLLLKPVLHLLPKNQAQQPEEKQAQQKNKITGPGRMLPGLFYQRIKQQEVRQKLKHPQPHRVS